MVSRIAAAEAFFLRREDGRSFPAGHNKKSTGVINTGICPFLGEAEEKRIRYLQGNLPLTDFEWVMLYCNDDVRRQDRLLDESGAIDLLRNGEFGIVSLVTPDGYPYGIPVSFVWDGADRIYFHCAREGKKLACIDFLPKASLCIVGKTNVVPDKFTTAYESVVLQCSMTRGLPPEERMGALKLLLEKYSPDDMAVGMKYAEKSFGRTEIVCMTIERFSGKCKRIT